MKKYIMIAILAFPVLFAFDIMYWVIFGVPAFGATYTDGRAFVGVALALLCVIIAPIEPY